MTRIYTTAHIDRPVELVYGFVTTPCHWPEWHPSSLAVAGTANHSLEVGEEVTEDFRVAGRRGQVVWRVSLRDAPRRWTIEGQLIGRTGGGTVSYTLTPEADGTFFEREFIYPTPDVLVAILDQLFVRRRIEAESSVALAQLKRLLESG